MKPSQIAQLAAAPLASLFLLLNLTIFLVLQLDLQKAPVGIQIPLLRIRAVNPNLRVDCGDTRTIVVSLHSSGELLINQDRTSWDAVAPTIGKFMHNRAEPIVFILADPEVPYQQVAVLMDKMSASTPGLHIGLLTREFQRRSIGPCDLRWPESVFNPAA